MCKCNAIKQYAFSSQITHFQSLLFWSCMLFPFSDLTCSYFHFFDKQDFLAVCYRTPFYSVNLDFLNGIKCNFLESNLLTIRRLLYSIMISIEFVILRFCFSQKGILMMILCSRVCAPSSWYSTIINVQFMYYGQGLVCCVLNYSSYWNLHVNTNLIATQILALTRSIPYLLGINL